jgi:hypothetical protein
MRLWRPLVTRHADVLDLPRAGLHVEAGDATLHRAVWLPKRSGVVAEALPELHNAGGFMDVAAHEQSAHAIHQLTDGLTANGSP